MKKVKKIKYISIAVVVIILSVLLKISFFSQEKPIEELLFEVPEMPQALSYNEKILFAVDSFVVLAKKEGTAEKLCKGGFINTESRSQLKQIAQTIIENRIINPYPLEFAFTQDEAGIVCLTQENKWVFFSALNPEEEIDTNYICADSLGRKGRLQLNREKISCE